MAISYSSKLLKHSLVQMPLDLVVVFSSDAQMLSNESCTTTFTKAATKIKGNWKYLPPTTALLFRSRYSLNHTIIGIVERHPWLFLNLDYNEMIANSFANMSSWSCRTQAQIHNLRSSWRTSPSSWGVFSTRTPSANFILACWAPRPMTPTLPTFCKSMRLLLVVACGTYPSLDETSCVSPGHIAMHLWILLCH